MVRIEISNRNISFPQKDELIANCVGFDKLAFSFDSEWDGLAKSIVFTNGDVTAAVPVVSEEPIDIPPEVLRAGNLYVSAVGVADNGMKKLSTKKLLEPLNVKESGSQPDDEQYEYTPSFGDQVLSLLEERDIGLTFDETPTEDSDNPVTSEGIYDALGERDTAIDGLRADLTAVQTRLTAAEGDIADLTEDMTAVQTRLTATEGDIADLNTDVTDARVRLTAAENNITDLTADMTAAQTRLTAAEGDISALDARISARNTVYGFRINSGEADPSTAVTYLADAVGMTPAHMDYANDRFDWGSWKENEFFMPVPCGLLATGRVLEYLDPNAYSKTVDGTPSHISDENGLFDPDTLADVTGIAATTPDYDSTATYSVGDYCIRTGWLYECLTAITTAEPWTETHWRLCGVHCNAMMEWGRDGKRIWCKIVPEGDGTSASIYIADSQIEDGYKAWPFINSQGVLVKHFYTPIYNGSIDSTGRLRSLSGRGYADLCQNKTAAQEIAAAKLNNLGTDELWLTEVWCDITLINILLVLMAKSLDTQTAYGQGRCGQTSEVSSMLDTGTMDDKGLFWGSSYNIYGVKTFGMENWWGNNWRRFCGLMLKDGVYALKYTYSRQDGSSADGYNTTGNGYLVGATAPLTGYVAKMRFDENGFLPAAVGSNSAHNWCDYYSQNNSGAKYAFRGGACTANAGEIGAFLLRLYVGPVATAWGIGAALSCKPLA